MKETLFDHSLLTTHSQSIAYGRVPWRVISICLPIGCQPRVIQGSTAEFSSGISGISTDGQAG